MRKYAYLLLCLMLSALTLSGQTGNTKQLRSSLLDSLVDEPVDSLVRHYLEFAGIQTHSGNSITLLESGSKKFDDLLRHLEGAKRHIHMEYFNFRNDSISHRVFALLRQKAQEGVKVRILFDAFGNMSNDRPLKRRHLDSIRQDSIQIVKFDPIRFPWVNHVSSRDHRKLVIIDGTTGYLGGMNIADYYIKGLEKIGSWRDMHCRLEGPAVADMQRIFIDMWQRSTGETLEGDEYYPSQEEQVEDCHIAIVDRSPRGQPDAIKDAYALSISGADSIVNIVNPYFVPTKAIMSAIDKALNKGVEVNIMVSEKSDIPFTPEAMLHKLNKLSKRGARVHLYTEGFHHSKVMTVDGKLATIGSANLNSRSLRYDYETNAFIFDANVTAKLDSIYTDDKKASIPLDRSYWRKRSLWKKFVGWFANIFTPFL